MTPTAREAPPPRGGDSARGPLFRKLKPGPGHEAEDVRAHQQARLQGAMVELVDQRGFPGVTVRGLSRAAGVSTRTFYKHFPNTEGCFASTYESLMRCSLQRASAPREAGEDWRRNVREGLRASMQGLAEYPKAAHLALVDSFAAGPAMLKQMRLSAREFELLLTAIFAEAPDEAAIPLRAVQGMVAGIMRAARTRLLTGRGAELPEIADELADWLLSLRDVYILDREDSAGPASAKQYGELGEKSELAAPPLEGFGDERGRILSAVARLGASDGYQALTVPRVRAEAGVSRRNFDAQFAGVDACFLEAIEVLTVAAASRAARRALGTEDWEHGIQQATAALCIEIARRPALAQLGFVEIFAPGRAGLDRRERLVTLGADRLRQAAPLQHRPSELAAEASVAAAWKIVQAEVAVGRARKLPRVAPTVAAALVAPVTGAAKAAQTILSTEE